MRRVNYPWYVIVLVVVTMLCTTILTTRVNAQQTIDTTTELIRDTTTVSTTMYNNCYDTTMFKGNARIEQMFVEDIYEEDGCYQVLLIDTTENEWVITDIDLFLGEEVLVLLTDNNTDELSDDVIVHCWVSVE